MSIPPHFAFYQEISMPKPNVYVAGPMRGYEDFNFPAFDSAAETLRLAGFNVMNPADRDREQHGPEVNKSATGDLAEIAHTGFDLREALSYDLAWIASQADAVAVLTGWEASRGAVAEVSLAHALGLVVAPVHAFIDGNLENLLVPNTVAALPANSISPEDVPATGVLDGWWEEPQVDFTALGDPEPLGAVLTDLTLDATLTDEAEWGALPEVVLTNKAIAALEEFEVCGDDLHEEEVCEEPEVWVEAPDDADYQLEETEADILLEPVAAVAVEVPRPVTYALGLVPIDESEASETTDLVTVSDETRTVSVTGGEKGVKSERFDLIPGNALQLLARLYGEGAKKYEDRNWERGYEFSKSFAALNRHLWLWWNGEDDDPETGVPHTVNVAWHALALTQFATEGRYAAFDDRPKRELP